VQECSETNLKKHEWDEFIKNNHGDYRQYYDWGTLKEKFCWEIVRLSIYDNKKLVSLFQLLIKTKGPLIFIYLPGSVDGCEKYLKNVLNFIKKKFKKFLFKYFRADLTSVEEPVYHFLKNKIGLKKTIYNRTGRTKIIIPIIKNIDDQIKNCDPKWRKSLRFSQRYKINIKTDEKPDVELVYKLSRQLEIDKKIGKGHSHQEVLSVFSIFEKNILFSKATDENGNILGFRAALVHYLNAWDFFAVTTKHGRKYKVGYPLMISILKKAQKKGVKNYNFIGDDPINMKNVFSFKKGLKGKVKNYVGEVEWSNFFILKFFFNFIFFLLYSKYSTNFLKKH